MSKIQKISIFLLLIGACSSRVLPAQEKSDIQDENNVSYNYKYSVNSPATGDVKSHQEERQGKMVKGEYSLLEPDGTTRIVRYTVGPDTGFQAIVEKVGEPTTTTTIPQVPLGREYENLGWYPQEHHHGWSTDLNGWNNFVNIPVFGWDPQTKPVEGTTMSTTTEMIKTETENNATPVSEGSTTSAPIMESTTENVKSEIVETSSEQMQSTTTKAPTVESTTTNAPIVESTTTKAPTVESTTTKAPTVESTTSTTETPKVIENNNGWDSKHQSTGPLNELPKIDTTLKQDNSGNGWSTTNAGWDSPKSITNQIPGTIKETPKTNNENYQPTGTLNDISSTTTLNHNNIPGNGWSTTNTGWGSPKGIINQVPGTPPKVSDSLFSDGWVSVVPSLEQDLKPKGAVQGFGTIPEYPTFNEWSLKTTSNNVPQIGSTGWNTNGDWDTTNHIVKKDEALTWSTIPNTGVWGSGTPLNKHK